MRLATPQERREAIQDKVIFGITEDILCLMEDKGMSNRQLAHKVKMSPRKVKQLLSGDSDMRVSELNDICFALDVKLEIRILPRNGL